jgi:hypothetical protein
LILYKVLHTQHRNAVSSLRIQPKGDLLAAAGRVSSQLHFPWPTNNLHADEFGCLLFFELSSEATTPQQSRQLLPEHGGISELCWVGSDILAVGTTRGRIIIYSCQNETVSYIISHPSYPQVDQIHRAGFVMFVTSKHMGTVSRRLLLKVWTFRSLVAVWSPWVKGEHA